MPRDLPGLRVCFVAGTLGQGGAERQLFYMLKALLSGGATPTVLSLARDEFWEAPIRSLGVPVAWVGRGRSRLARLSAIIRAARRERPHVVQSQHFYMNLYAVLAARAARAVGVGAIRSNVRAECGDVGRLGPLSLSAPRILAVNSRAALENAVSRGVPPSRLHLVDNVVDTTIFAPGERQLRRGEASPLRVLGVGRNGPEKRFDLFLDVLAGARRQSRRAITGVLVTPDAADGARLRQQAQQRDLPPDALELHHAVSDVASVYRGADLFMLTSDFEGTPNVILEAMACGLPIVSTRVGGVPDVVQHGSTGWLCGTGAASDLEAAVVALAADDERRHEMGRRARAFVDTRHSLPALTARLSEFYQAVTR